ncbi:MAG: VWA domain-containing protein [Clostridia bacterium]|nr:VWA domain-containing protein [Clostridia bacterium]
MSANSTTKDRKVDIIFCIDATGSMSPCIGKVKDNAKKFYRDCVDQLTNVYGNNVEELNIKVITFRDYLDDGDSAMEISEWFDMTAGDADKYEAYLNSIIADGGGPSPEENGLEALYYAMTADWNAKGDNDRQVIVLFSDADALELKDSQRVGLPNYPTDMVDKDGLISLWAGIRPDYMSQGDFKLKQRNKRLLMYAPDNTVYQKICGMLDQSQFRAVSMDAGLQDMNFDDVIRNIAASVSSGGR